jgi:hypothetical protein
MKTITEYRPMIFSVLAAHAEESSQQFRRWGTNIAATLAYGAIGLWLSCDTGIPPWHWKFWVMFAPLFVAGELALRRRAGG